MPFCLDADVWSVRVLSFSPLFALADDFYCDIIVDCWDGEDGDPIIYHGHTMVSKIKFRDVIETVLKFGFEASPYHDLPIVYNSLLIIVDTLLFFLWKTIAHQSNKYEWQR